ncbi:hypothetical protein DXT89_14395 [Agrobacterium vitis]|uniref:Uncharacterized protein n=1 Tax=Agrobacterium vitis TaxID=373 RepID=A0A368NWW1_AGRVI|nr:hypothetical protein DXM22_21010 [Agrobacterium vitis]KAA3526568.1 hypothetical protein DXT89_14395 [Agrobacterium vitis]RCU54235.1 hypothetical protein ASB66_014585 [Agrobacterium vitis]
MGQLRNWPPDWVSRTGRFQPVEQAPSHILAGRNSEGPVPGQTAISAEDDPPTAKIILTENFPLNLITVWQGMQ